MPGSKSNYLENLTLQFALSTANITTRPAAWHVALFTDAAGLSADPGPTTEATTVNCPGYARQQVTSWTISGTNPTQAQNANAVTFTASNAWATVNYFGIYDASTAGNLLYWGSITAKTLANTDQLQFAINAITITDD